MICFVPLLQMNKPDIQLNAQTDTIENNITLAARVANIVAKQTARTIKERSKVQ